MDSYGWLLDPKRCIECRACEAACKQYNDLETGTRLRQVRISENGKFPTVTVHALSIACNHCDKAMCLRACPVKAISRRPDGIVLVDREKCLGCGECTMFCPYDAPQVDYTKSFLKGERKMRKCTMCADRIDQGLEPACSSICPTGALKWGKWNDIRNSGDARHDALSDPSYTDPHIRFVTAAWTAR